MKMKKYGLFVSVVCTTLIRGYSYTGHFEGADRSIIKVYDSSNPPIKAVMPAGKLDITFGTGGVTTAQMTGTTNNSATALYVDNKNRVICVGESDLGAHSRLTLLRLTVDGTVDGGFGSGGYVVTDISTNNNYAQSVVIDSQNRIVVAGVNNSQPVIARYLEDGTLDTTYGGAGGITTTTITDGGSSIGIIIGMAIDSQGRLVVVGYTDTNTNDFLIVRYTTAGVLDTAGFNAATGYLKVNVGGNDKAYSVAVDGSDNIFVAGASGNDFGVIKVTSVGALDTAFATSGKFITDFAAGTDVAYSIKIDQKGRLLVCGVADGSFGLLRLTAAGVLDTSFGTAGVVTYSGGLTAYTGGYKIAQIDALGRIVISGALTTTQNAFVTARFLPDGAVDTSYGTAGITSTIVIAATDADAYGSALDNQGRLVIGGACNQKFAVARYTIDYTFGYYKAQFATRALGLLA